MNPTLTLAPLLELLDSLCAELARLEARVCAGQATPEEYARAFVLEDARGALMWAIRGAPLYAGTLAAVLLAARALEIPQEDAA